MNVIDPGRSYELVAGNMLRFVQKVGATVVRDGTTNEEVLDVLIHRVTEAYQTLPCRETVRALFLLYEAQMAFRLRTERRSSARVDGTLLPHDAEGDDVRFARLRGAMNGPDELAVAPADALVMP